MRDPEVKPPTKRFNRKIGEYTFPKRKTYKYDNDVAKKLKVPCGVIFTPAAA